MGKGTTIMYAADARVRAEASRVGRVLGFDSDKFFVRYGGLALGLEVAKRLQGLIGWWNTPSYHGIARTPFPAGAERFFGAGRRLDPGKEYVVKASGLKEAFSDFAVRGKNSSSRRRRVRGHATCETVLDSLDEVHIDEDLRSLVVQEVLAATRGRYFLVHAEEDGCVVEQYAGDWTYLAEIDRSGTVLYREATRYADLDNEEEILAGCRKVAEANTTAAATLGFGLNTEGLLDDDGTFWVLQLRPVPADRPIDPLMSTRLNRLLPRAIAYTRFVWGVFDVCAKIPGPEEPDVTGEVMVAPSMRARAMSAGEPATGGATAPRAARRPVWDDDVYRRAVQSARPLIVLDVEGGFHINHDVEFLPRPGPMRARYRYVSLPARLCEEWRGQAVRIVCDGSQAVVTPADPE